MNNHPHILGIWELGAGNGHIARLDAIGRQLTQAGYNFTFVARDLTAVQSYTGEPAYPLLQAPYVHQRTQPARPLVCMADVLALQGFANGTSLQGQQAGWRTLFDVSKPDLVILDHAPSALLAAHETSIPKLVIGNSFMLPVPGRPLIDWRPLLHPDQLVSQSENHVLGLVNAFLENRGQQSLQLLADLYASQGLFISSFPLLDRQAEYRTEVSYHTSSIGQQGSMLTRSRQHPVSLLCYLHPAYKCLDLLLQALAWVQGNIADVMLICPGLHDSAIGKLQQSGISASNKRVNMEQAMNDADWFLGHGGIGSLTQALRSGKPVIALPQQLEQLNNALKLQEAGLGEIIPEQTDVQIFTELLTKILRQTGPFTLAREFADANLDYARVPLETALLSRIQELLPA